MAEKKYRLLLCLECQTLEQLEDFQGDPRDDVILETLVSRHVFPSGEPHKGQLMDVAAKHWDSRATRAAIQRQIRESSGHTGLDSEFYAAKDTFTEDALKCFAAHNRNPVCPDYKSDAKIILPDTAGERRELGLSVKDRPKRWLCEFCPVHSLVKQAQYQKAGLAD